MPVGRKPGLNRNDTPYRALSHLANTGPQEEATLRAFIRALASGSNDPQKAAYHVLHGLAKRGLVRTKVWLTPEGLEELRRTGWTPARLEDEEPVEP
jgi:hypothetical protein